MAHGEFLGTLEDGSNLFVGNHSGFYGDKLLQKHEGFPQGTASAVGDIGVTIYRQRYNKIDPDTLLPKFYPIPIDSVRGTDEGVDAFIKEQEDSDFAKTEEILVFLLDDKAQETRDFMDQIDLVSLYSSDGPDRMKQHHARKIQSPSDGYFNSVGRGLAFDYTYDISEINGESYENVRPIFNVNPVELERASYKFTTQNSILKYLSIANNILFQGDSPHAVLLKKFAKLDYTRQSFEDRFAPPQSEVSLDITEDGGITGPQLRKWEQALSRLEISRAVGDRRTSDADITCLLYTSPSPRDRQKSRMPSSA